MGAEDRAQAAVRLPPGGAEPARGAGGARLGATAAPIFLLVPQVKLPKRLDLARDAGAQHEAVPEMIMANWVERL